METYKKKVEQTEVELINAWVDMMLKKELLKKGGGCL